MFFPYANRRRSERIGAVIPGRIYFSSARPSLDCRLRNVSDGGACLSGPGVCDLPDRFRLEIPARNRIVAAHVRWRSGDLIGVEFEQVVAAPRVASAKPPPEGGRLPGPSLTKAPARAIGPAAPLC